LCTKQQRWTNNKLKKRRIKNKSRVEKKNTYSIENEKTHLLKLKNKGNNIE
jgi:hypothetical protein